jgi:hypothetical protein
MHSVLVVEREIEGHFENASAICEIILKSGYK